MTARAIALAAAIASSACLSTPTDPNAGRTLELPPSPDGGDGGEGGSDAGPDAPVDSAPPVVDSGGGG